MEDETTEAFAITYSTAYIGIAALLTMRDNEDDLFDDATIEYASKVLEYIRNQPDRVLNLEAEEMKMIGPYLVSDTRVWIDE